MSEDEDSSSLGISHIKSARNEKKLSSQKA